ncbi:MAG TPA: hypothetical protein DIW31_08750 [Bacteroidales bacterium]|nr:hypothetical protein [Bacteroidales bacterium]
MNSKKLFLYFLIMACSINLFSQEKQKKYLIGGSVGFSFKNEESEMDGLSTNKYNQFASYLSPTFGYFVNNNLAIGLELTYSISRINYKESGMDYYNNERILASPFIRYYVTQYLFLKGQGYFGKAKTKYKATFFEPIEGIEATEIIKNESKTLGFSVGMGGSVKVAENIFLEPMVSYIHLRDKSDSYVSKSIENEVVFSLGLTIII